MISRKERRDLWREAWPIYRVKPDMTRAERKRLWRAAW